MNDSVSQQQPDLIPPTRSAPTWERWTNLTPQYIRYGCFLWQFTKHFFNLYLCYRQYKVLNERRRIPRVLFGKIPPESFAHARSYHKDLLYLEMFSCFYFFCYEVWKTLFSGTTKLWFLSGPIFDTLGFWPQDWDRETGESIVFMFLIAALRECSKLPINIWRTFVVEEKHGFNNMTFGNFIVDKLKVFLLEVVYAIITSICVLWIVKGTGQFFPIWLCLFSFCWLLLTLAIYPNFIAPIFDTYSQLREGRLRNRLNRLANFLGFPLHDIQILHQSWRSEHRDAYFYGMLDMKRIVLYDTLLAGYPEADTSEARKRERLRDSIPKKTEHGESVRSVPSTILRKAGSSNVYTATAGTSQDRGNEDNSVPSVSRTTMYDTGFTEHEIEAVVARLIGHWVLGHSVKELVLPVISLFLFFFIFSFVYQNSSLYTAFSMPHGRPVLLGLLLLYKDCMDVYNLSVEFVMHYLARAMAYEADAFATRLGYGEELIDAYIEAEKENLDYPYFDELYWVFHYSEPSVLQSIAAIEKDMERMEWKKTD